MLGMTTVTVAPAQEEVAFVIVIVPLAEATDGVFQPLIQVPPELETFTDVGSSLLKSNPLVELLVPVSGNPSLTLPVVATGILIKISPPVGIVLTRVKVKVILPDWVDMAYPAASMFAESGVEVLKVVAPETVATV